MLKKRRLTAVMAALLSISLVACGGQPKAEERPKAPASGDKSPAQADPKFSITAIDFRYGDPPPTSSPGIDMINEKFNVDYKPVFVPNTAFDEKINAVFASGQIPDMIGLMSTDLKTATTSLRSRVRFGPRAVHQRLSDLEGRARLHMGLHASKRQNLCDSTICPEVSGGTGDPQGLA